MKPWQSLGILFSLVCSLFFSGTLFAANNTAFTDRPDVASYKNYLVNKYNFNRNDIDKIFARIKLQPKVIKLMQRPYEAQPWYIYKKHFLSSKRIKQGAKFWAKHKKTLDAVEKKYGVPSKIIVAIIGVESHYGTHLGKYRVADVLSTLAFDYPKRSKFFKKELTHLLLLSREQKIDPLSLYGSYAGAIGQPQFMPSSYRSYAVNYTQSGHADLIADPDDIIASVANYMEKNGWKEHGIVTVPAQIKNKHPESIVSKSRKPSLTLKQWKTKGAMPVTPVPNDPKAIVFELENRYTTPSYRFGFNNFYVITRYNTSTLYAMAVYELSQEIEKQYNKNTHSKA